MNRLKQWLFIAGIMVAMTSCEPDPVIPEPAPPAWWEKFIGTYNVTKLENGDSYTLQLAMDSSYIEPSGRRVYKMLWLNFDGLFDTLSGEFTRRENPDELDSFYAPFGTIDNYGNRWAIWMLQQDTLTPELENTLVNDTILFYFRKSNIAFYFEDGVPYYDCYCKHLAVRVQ